MSKILRNHCKSEKKKVRKEDELWIHIFECLQDFRGQCFITVPWHSLHWPLQHTSQELLIIHQVLVVPLRPAQCGRNPALPE